MPEAQTRAAGIYRLPPNQIEALPMAVLVVAQLLEAEGAESKLRLQLETERACESLGSCLEPGKLYPMALELLLDHLDCRRGIAFFSTSSSPGGAGVAARGFTESIRDGLIRILRDEKSLESTMGEGEVSVVPWGPLHHALGRVGLENPGAFHLRELGEQEIRGMEQKVHLYEVFDVDGTYESA